MRELLEQGLIKVGRGGAGWLGGWLGVHFGWGHVGVPGARARPGEHPPNYRLHLLTPRCLPASPPPCCPPRLWPRPTPRPSTPAPPRSEGAQGQQAVRPPGCKPQGRSGSSSGGGGYIRARRRPPPGRAGAPSSPPPRVFSSRLARLRRAGLVDVTMVMVSGDPGGGATACLAAADWADPNWPIVQELAAVPTGCQPGMRWQRVPGERQGAQPPGLH